MWGLHIPVQFIYAPVVLRMFSHANGPEGVADVLR